MSALVIRPFRPADAVGTSELFRRVYGYHYVSPDVYLPHMICQHNLHQRWHSMVAVLDERVVGHAALCQAAPRHEDAELALMAVDPTLQGSQIATRLGRQLLERCQDLGLARLSIKQVTSHPYSQRLAQRLGFHDTGLMPDHVPSPFDVALAETVVVGCQMIQDHRRPLPSIRWPATCQWFMAPMASRFGVTLDDAPCSVQPLQLRQLPGRVDVVAGHIGRHLARQLQQLPAHWSISVRLSLRRQFNDDYRRLMAAGFIFTGLMPGEADISWQALFHRGALARRLDLISAPMQRLHEQLQAHTENWRGSITSSAA
ncbi:GNAT family N-acetyltransferase [Pseudomonas sp. 21TX0197]|uniref:GNAT family N-acetyltransferase n=1 Tax=unclassified Pseudomonas TaxID=196821 RepID=UPI000918ABF9|nr:MULTISPECIES: GNAT family N-acetyltransferase [unclassified Pseudomonas]MDB6445666.1 GNAT family N-acetyltransferase [Pseudomonas sp. 21TX0197]SFY04644.1 Predicted N-acetyltransferase YhbS [Pseudomonas sp. NFACC49-2]SFY17986.1 Predicted N-acetyltransferase YhbS [Pseudomonas sp. NFACC36]